jgi:putative copper export protein
LTGTAIQLAPTVDNIRLFLHVLGATVWVGGQIVVLGLLPTVRAMAPGGPKAVAQAFARLAWPGYLLLVATGFWNLAAAHPSEQSTTWNVVLGVKLALVVLAGVATFLHQRSTSRSALAVWGSLAGLSSIVALYMGVVLAG